MLLLITLTAVGCAGVLESLGLDRGPGEMLEQGSRALDAGDFREASEIFRYLAARCHSGEAGESAVLALAAAELDPRNPSGSPAAAAQLAARYLQIPSPPPAGLAHARTLYLLALELGAPPVREPFAPVLLTGAPAREEPASTWRPAERFESCGVPEPSSADRRLPEHPGPPLRARLDRVSAHRDSLAHRLDSLSAAADDRARRLRARVDSLEAELERIRALLREGVGRLPPSSAPPPP